MQKYFGLKTDLGGIASSAVSGLDGSGCDREHAATSMHLIETALTAQNRIKDISIMNILAKPNLRSQSTQISVSPIAIALWVFAFAAAAQTPPPAPSLAGPAAGAAPVQPITLGWNPVLDPDGPIGSYLWQVGTSLSFGTIIAQEAQNLSADDIPVPTHDKVSGLPNGTYFWCVKATQMVGGAVGAIESAWSQVRSFTVTGLGPAPGTPTFTSPANGSQFHAVEFFDITGPVW